MLGACRTWPPSVVALGTSGRLEERAIFHTPQTGNVLRTYCRASLYNYCTSSPHLPCAKTPQLGNVCVCFFVSSAVVVSTQRRQPVIKSDEKTRGPFRSHNT